MTDPASPFILTKILASAAGLVGGLSLSLFWQPERIRQYGRLAAGAIAGGVSVGGAFTLSGILAKLMGLDFQDIDTALALGFVTGILSVGVVNLLANFFERRESADLLEVARELRRKRGK